MSVEVSANTIPDKAQIIIDAWDEISSYYQESMRRFTSLSESYSNRTGVHAYHLASPIEEAGDFCIDHIRSLVHIAESHFAVGNVKLSIEATPYLEAAGARVERGRDPSIKDEAAANIGLEAIWRLLEKDHGNSRGALEKASKDNADILFDAIRGISRWEFDKKGHRNVAASKQTMVERTVAAFKVTKAYHIFTINAEMETVSSYETIKGVDYKFSWGGGRKTAKVCSALINWLDLGGHSVPGASELVEDLKAVIAKAEDRESGFDLGDKLVHNKRIRMTIRKGKIEIALQKDIARAFQDFLIGWATVLA